MRPPRFPMTLLDEREHETGQLNTNVVASPMQMAASHLAKQRPVGTQVARARLNPHHLRRVTENAEHIRWPNSASSLVMIPHFVDP